MSTSVEIQRAQIAGAKIGITWQEKHLHDYFATPERSKMIGDYLREKGLPFTEASLDAALYHFKSKGIDMSSQVAPGAQVDEFAAFPLPSYMPDIRTKSDIHAVPHEDFRKFMTGKDKAAWQARVKFILEKPAEDEE